MLKATKNLVNLVAEDYYAFDDRYIRQKRFSAFRCDCIIIYLARIHA